MEINETSIFNSDSGHYPIFVYFTFAAIFVIICESVLVIVIICRTTNLNTNTDIIIASLCANNILSCLAYIAHSVIGLLLSHIDEQINNTITSVVLGVFFGTTFTSYTHMGCVAVDRYICISQPFYYIKNMTRKRNFKVLLALWITGLVYMIVPVFVYRDRKYHHQLIAINPPLEYISVSYIAFILTTLIASTCYFKIAQVAFHHKKASNARRSPHSDDNSEKVLARNRKAAMKSVKFFAVTFGLFLLFTSPMLIVSVLGSFYEISEYLYMFKGAMYLLNSCMTSLMYSFMRKEFSKSLKTAITVALQRCKTIH